VERPLALDMSVPMIAAAAERLWPGMVSLAEKAIMRKAQKRVGDVGDTLEPIDAGEALGQILHSAEGLAAAAAQHTDPYGWLWYLRRLPEWIFAGELSTTEPYDAMLATVLSAQTARRAEHEAHDGNVQYPLDDAAIRAVLWLCAIAIVASEVHGKLRRAGKGQAFVLAADQLPRSVSNDALAEAIAAYDMRTAADAGLESTSLAQAADAARSQSWPLLVAAQVERRQSVPGWRGPLADMDVCKLDGRYVPQFLALDALADVVADAGGLAENWWEPGLSALIVLLRAVCFDVFFRSPSAGFNVPNVGYLVLPRATVLDLLGYVLETTSADIASLLTGAEVPSSPSAVLAGVEAIAGQSWPMLPGPVIRRAGEQVVIDLVAAYSRLIRMVTVASGRGGVLVNSEAAHFEQVVQRVVNASAWRPEPGLADVRGRHLRLGGQTITDIDAIACHGGTSLLISCKSVAYTSDYDAGAYNVVRNARTMLEKAVREWDGKLETLRSNPVGDNYDFSGVGRIEGVVVTPHVLFVHAGELLTPRQINNRPLLPVVSVGELRKFLSSHRRPGRSAR
jgi:hypothetical protein